MMKLFKSDLQKLAAALTLGALSVGFAPSAAAISSFDAYAELSVTLTNVTNLGGQTVTTGWEVTASGDGATSGSGTTSIDVIGGPVSLGVGDMVTQSASASGTVTSPGVVNADAFTTLEMLFSNQSTDILVFTVEYNVIGDVMASSSGNGDASAFADIGLYDDFDDLLVANLEDQGFLGLTGTLNFTVFAGDPDYFLGGYADAYGDANVVIPVPAAVWLFGSGLLGLIGIARRRQAA